MKNISEAYDKIEYILNELKIPYRKLGDSYFFKVHLEPSRNSVICKLMIEGKNIKIKTRLNKNYIHYKEEVEIFIALVSRYWSFPLNCNLGSNKLEGQSVIRTEEADNPYWDLLMMILNIIGKHNMLCVGLNEILTGEKNGLEAYLYATKQ